LSGQAGHRIILPGNNTIAIAFYEKRK